MEVSADQTHHPNGIPAGKNFQWYSHAAFQLPSKKSMSLKLFDDAGIVSGGYRQNDHQLHQKKIFCFGNLRLYLNLSCWNFP